MEGIDRWNSRRMFDLYLLDYLRRNNLHATAASFSQEANVPWDLDVAIGDSPRGFLDEWWTIMYETILSRIHMRDTGAVPPPPVPNQEVLQVRQLLSGAPSMIADQPQPPPLVTNQHFRPLMAPPGFPVVPSRNFSNYLHLPSTSASTSAALQQVQHPLMMNYRPSIQGSSLARHPEIQTPDAVYNSDNSRRIKRRRPMLLEGQPINSLTEGRRNQLTICPEAEQAQQQNLTASGFVGNLECSGPTRIDNANTEEVVTLNNRDRNGQNLRQNEMQSERGRDDRNLLETQQLEDTGNFPLEVIDDREIEDFLDLNFEGHNLDEDFALLESGAQDIPTRKGGGSGLIRLERARNLKTGKSKMRCCHFSSDGKMLACSGHEKNVWVWNTETSTSHTTAEGHSQLVTDIRFRPNSTIVATSSFDKTVQIWDAAKSSGSLYKLEGHGEQILSLDFHPRKADLLSSCDRNDEIRLWNIDQNRLLGVYKGATEQVRYRPESGNLLAVATGNVVRVLESETNAVSFELKGHVEDVRSVCWDSTGNYIASVSEDSARVWSLVGGKLTNKLFAYGRKFTSCAFHPRYPEVLVVGGYKYLELWSLGEPRTKWSTQGHNGIVTSISGSRVAGYVATVSRDDCRVKLWR